MRRTRRRLVNSCLVCALIPPPCPWRTVPGLPGLGNTAIFQPRTRGTENGRGVPIMKRITLVSFYVALGGALLAPSLSRAEVSCTRPGLQQAVDLYVTAQTKGDLTALPLAKGVGYWENAAP